MVGKVLAGRYELLEKIGEGGMARVYRGRDNLLRRTVAVKILKDQMTGDADFIRRFRREAQAAAGLSHPHIVNVYDVGEENDIYYIVMEYVDGKNLKQYIREKGRLTASEAVAIVRQIAEALVQAHDAGVIHRDIKPQNILFSRYGEVKVADFGIAIAADGSTLTCSDDVIGSVHYFSPEQARGNLAGKQSDLYSLGIILYEMVTGRVPFSGESPVSVAMKHVQEPIEPPRRLVDSIPEPLERIILKAVQKEPNKRYQDARSFLEDLKLFQEKGSCLARPEIAAADDEETIVMKPVSAAPVKLREKSWFMPLLIVLLLGVTLLVGFIAARDLLFPSEVVVPDVRGLPQNDAVAVLQEQGLRPNPTVTYVYDDTVPVGHVVRTDPYQERTVRKNRTIELLVSKGPEYILAPDLYLKTENEARILLQEMKLVPDVIRENHDEVPEGKIFRQVPSAGTRLAPGEQVIIYVSQGSNPFPINNLIGLSREKAEEYLQQVGLKSRLAYKISDEPAGTVVAQYPEPGQGVKRGQTVDLVVSKGSSD